MLRNLLNGYLKKKQEKKMVIWTFGGPMYLAIASCILYVNNDYFKFDKVGI